MKILICLRVKYGFPLSALHGFLSNLDYPVWSEYLNKYSNDICFSLKGTSAYWLVSDCGCFETFKQGLGALPLMSEEFVEFEILPLSEFSDLHSMFFN